MNAPTWRDYARAIFWTMVLAAAGAVAEAFALLGLDELRRWWKRRRKARRK